MAGLDHVEAEDQSTFVWFVSMLVLLATISTHIIWKILVTCFSSIKKIGNGNDNMKNNLAHTNVKPSMRDASVQTIERYGGEVRLGSVWVTKTGERYHRYGCGHISCREAKVMTPCRDCIHG